jgi:hypothetical protein
MQRYDTDSSSAGDQSMKEAVGFGHMYSGPSFWLRRGIEGRSSQAAAINLTKLVTFYDSHKKIAHKSDASRILNAFVT